MNNKKKLFCCFWYSILKMLNTVSRDTFLAGDPTRELKYAIKEVTLAGKGLTEVLNIQEQPELVWDDLNSEYEQFLKELAELWQKYLNGKVKTKAIILACQDFSETLMEYANDLEITD